MNRQDLITLAKASITPSTEFSVADANSAFRNAVLEQFGLDANNVSLRDIRRCQNEMFALVEEIVDEMLPAALQEYVGTFAEVKQYARDAQPIFLLKNINKNRVAMGITEVARGGVYKARRLDNSSMVIQTKAQGVAYLATLEDLLLGKSTIADLVEILVKGFADRMFIEVIQAVRALYANIPANNKATVATNDSAAISVGLDKVIKTVRRYGSPVILAFDSVAANILSIMGDASKISKNVVDEDIMSIRQTGYVKSYKGNVPVVVLPNYFIDNSNTTVYFKENDVWVLPSDNKPVVIALQGEAYTREVQQVHGGIEYHVHKMCGVGIMFNNQVGMVRVTAADQSGLY